MAVMRNEDIKTLNKVWKAMNEMYQNKKLSEEDKETLFEFSILMKEIVAEKEIKSKKAKDYIMDKRRTDKNYARGKK